MQQAYSYECHQRLGASSDSVSSDNSQWQQQLQLQKLRKLLSVAMA